MRQVSEKTRLFIKEVGFEPLLLYVSSNDISQVKYKDLKIKWYDVDKSKEAILREEKKILLIRAQESISYIFLLVIDKNKINLPEEKEVENLIDILDIREFLVWRNEFLFKRELREEIIKYITRMTIYGNHIVLIRRNLFNMGYKEKEIEHIFSMHPLYSNTDLLVCAYPERKVFLDMNKLRSFEDVKKEWVKENPNYEL